jgi:hypothetical protein
METFKVGDAIHGFAGGYFGRDSYECRLVEAVGKDWIVTRNTVGQVELARGSNIVYIYGRRDDRSFCSETCNPRWGVVSD